MPWQYYYSEELSVHRHKHPKLNSKEKQKQQVCIKFVTTSKTERLSEPSGLPRVTAYDFWETWDDQLRWGP